jgi:hypothetical protein
MFTPDIKDDKVKWAQTSSTFDNDEISKAIVAKISTVVSGLAWQNKLNNISFDTVVLWGLETQPWQKSIQLPQRRETIKFQMPSDIFPFSSGRNVFFIAWFWNFKQRVPQLLLNYLSVGMNEFRYAIPENPEWLSTDRPLCPVTASLSSKSLGPMLTVMLKDNSTNWLTSNNRIWT